MVKIRDEFKTTGMDNTNYIVGYRGIIRDVTQKKTAEDAYKASEEKFRNIFEQSPIGILLFDSNGCLVDANKACLQIFGISGIEDIKGYNFFSDPNTSDYMRTELGNCKKGKKVRLECVYDFEKVKERGLYKTTKSDIIYLDLLATFLVKKGEGSLEGYLGQVQEITERKQLQREMARLDRLNHMGEMAAGIGHEIRNSMTTLRGYLQLLGGKKEFTNYKDRFELMISELDRVNEIISNFLNMARNKKVDLKLININNIIKTMHPLIQADAFIGDKNIDLELGDIPDLLLDEKEIRQLILNLARNGLEAMALGGVLTLKTFVEDEEVVLAVRDHGHGIEPGILEKIGSPFLTTKENGTGLGLAVCYSIAARHSAIIKIKTSSSGTTFFVKFKCKKTEKKNISKCFSYKQNEKTCLSIPPLL